MERLKVWLNKQIAKILGDLQEREPVEDPSPTRAYCRVFFMVSLLLGFLLLLVYMFIDAPDARVVQIHRLTPRDKNDAFPSCFMYDRNSTKCKKWPKAKFPPKIPVSCPCTNSSAPWKNFVKFYVLHENSTDWNMSFTTVSHPGVAPQHNQDISTAQLEYPKQVQTPESDFNPSITVPDDTIQLGNESVVKDTEFLTAEKFCSLSSLWPDAIDSTVSPDLVEYVAVNVTKNPILREHCVWMATLLFLGSNKDYEDRTRSTQSLNTPNLLNREELNTLLAQLARESVVTRRLALDMILSLDAGKANFRRFINALAHLLTRLLDRDEMNASQSYVYGAKDLSGTLSSNQFYDPNAFAWYLGDDSGPIFLQPEIDWEAYRLHCNPRHCEVTKPMEEARRLYWALGILGGVATVVLAFVTTLLWPCTAMLLRWISGGKAAAQGVLLHWISQRMLLHWISELKSAQQRPPEPVELPESVELPEPVELTSGS